ncbi:MAG: DoxX family protein [Bacteroidales bacterium]|nr:DoxX family protein [Bacteroidales bacterium]
MKNVNLQYSTWQLTWLVILRVLIGWHFLYEGMVKLVNPNWSSVGYLLDSSGRFKEVFFSIAANPDLLKIADFLNVWGLIAIGLGLILGVFTRVATWSGIVLLGFYYLSHPPFIGLSYSMPMEGSYFIVNKVLIEMVAMIVLLIFPTGRQIGLDRFIFKRKK